MGFKRNLGGTKLDATTTDPPGCLCWSPRGWGPNVHHPSCWLMASSLWTLALRYRDKKQHFVEEWGILMTQIHRFLPWGPAVLSPCVHCTLEVGWECLMAQVAVFPGPYTSDVAGTSETTGWRVGYTILLGPARLRLPFSKVPSLVPSLNCLCLRCDRWEWW